jgi:NADH dehydrogenase FAD-containing subunit
MNSFQQNENEHPDHFELRCLLQEAKPLVMPMFPDQRKKWVAESSLAQEIVAILVKHPQYYDEFRALEGGIFAELKP